MREFFLKFFGAVALSVAAFTANADDLKDFQKQVINPVVQLSRNCSGVVIDTDRETTTYVLTANHCVEGEKSGFINLDTKEKQKLIETQSVVYDVIQRDTTNDLAFLKVRKEGLMLDGAAIVSEDPPEGTKAVVVGYPLGYTKTIVDGYMGDYESIDPKLTRFDPYGNERALRRATPPITGGNSGGGLFVQTDGQWKLAGISDAGFRGYEEAALFVPVKPINDIVTGALKSETKVETPKLPPRDKEKE